MHRGCSRVSVCAATFCSSMCMQLDQPSISERSALLKLPQLRIKWSKLQTEKNNPNCMVLHKWTSCHLIIKHPNTHEVFVNSSYAFSETISLMLENIFRWKYRHSLQKSAAREATVVYGCVSPHHSASLKFKPLCWQMYHAGTCIGFGVVWVLVLFDCFLVFVVFFFHSFYVLF